MARFEPPRAAGPALDQGTFAPQSLAKLAPALRTKSGRAAAGSAHRPRAGQVPVRQQAAALPATYDTGTTDMNQALSYGTRLRQLRLAALPSAVPWGRRVLRQVLREWQLESMSDRALLLVSELVTNAVKASGNGARGGHPPIERQIIALTVRLTDTSLMMEVWDANPAPPVLQGPDLTGDGGRGLLIVECLGDNWGHHAADGGKVVWCEVAFPS